ncbi:tetratricopeptide repeat protein [Actinophytocola sp.]|uniref:tetratricopeptide repeat protein n=1 Tax=Actinophytocola sp. TaxID=1872138 RepID=UPI00389B1C3E
MELRILGQVRLLMQEQVDLGATKVRGLLGYLSYRANEPVHVDRIAEALWDGGPRRSPGKALHTYASRLRRVLRDAGCPADLRNAHRSYRLVIDPSTVDYHRFLGRMREGHRARGGGDQEAAAEHFAAALALWDGSPLADLDTDWARRNRETMTSLELIPAHCALFDTRMSLGDHDVVLDGLPPLMSDHPADERLAIRWIRALAAADRAEEVPVFFREFAGRLLADLATRPSAELVETAREATTRRLVAVAPCRPAPPRDTPDFTGRAALLAELDALLDPTGRVVDVVALDGPPGIGKTALVRHWAHLRLPWFPDGVLYVDMAGYAETPLVMAHAVMAVFLAELGVSPTRIPDATGERAALLRALLSSRSVLVVLDNARDSDHVRPLLEATSPCPALITSRQRLSGITYRGGVPLSIPALPPDEATALLTKRIGPRSLGDEAAFATLVELCRGLPLALRIVGEHVAMRPMAPIGDLAAELAERLLDAGSHGDTHTTTLRCAFSVSYRALRPAEQRLFRLLGLHPGTRFSVHAVRALAGGEVDALLDALVGAHLVTQEGAGRYSIHDLLHVYATDTVHADGAAADRERATHRLFDWYLRSAQHARSHLVNNQHVPVLTPVEPVEEMTFAGNDEALRWFVTERPNLVACTYRAAQLGYHEHVWRLAACLSVLSRREDPRDLVEIHELGHRSARLVGNTAAAGGCLNNKGVIYVQLGDEENACRCFEQAYEAFTEAGDERGLAVFTHNNGSMRLALGQPVEAIEWFTRSLAMHSRVSGERHIANSHRGLGDAYRMLDRFAEARSHYRQSYYISQKITDPAGEATSLSRLAKLAVDENRLDEAVSYGEAALDMFDRVQLDENGTATALYVLATAHLRLGAPEVAIPLAREAVRRHQEIRNISGQIDGLLLLGRAQAAAGDDTEAASTWATAELLTSPSDPRGEVLRELLDAGAARPVPAPRAEDTVGGTGPRDTRKSVEDVG